MSGLSICVYCGSRPGSEAAYTEAAEAVGRAIGERGWRLVYGGGRAGLMGSVADAALQAGAEVVGVIPTSLMTRELGHTGLTELHVVETMHERKRIMAEHADAFLALPGGIGTFEELFEAWTWRQLGYHAKPLGILNVAGYYDLMFDFIDRSVGQGFLGAAQLDMVHRSGDVASLLDELGALAKPAGDYRKI